MSLRRFVKIVIISGDIATFSYKEMTDFDS